MVVSLADDAGQPPGKTGENREETTALAETWVGGGEEGIRTLETVPRLHTFQACAFDHSATSPSLMTSLDDKKKFKTARNPF